MHSHRDVPLRNPLLVALVSGAVGAWLTIAYPSASGVPDAGALVRARGMVSEIAKQRSGFRFALRGDERTYFYPAKAGHYAEVYAAVSAAGVKPVAIAYAAEARGAPWSERRHHEVWEVAVDETPVRTFADASAAWMRDNRLTRVTGLALLLGAVAIVYSSRRRRSATTATAAG